MAGRTPFACLSILAVDDGDPSSTSDGQGCSKNVKLPKNSAPVTPAASSRKMTARADDPTGNDFGGWRPASVTGTVVSDDNGDGARDSGEGGLAGIAVFADQDVRPHS